MNEKDIRVRKTNLKLSEVLLTLLEEHWLTKITINQICQHANVHRTTFYKHFKDKYELLFYVSKMTMKPYFSLALEVRLHQPFSSIEKTFNTQIFKILRTQKGDPKFYPVMLACFYDCFQKELQQYEATLPSEVSFPIQSFSYVYTATIRSINQWFTDNHIDSTADDKDQIYQQVVNLNSLRVGNEVLEEHFD